MLACVWVAPSRAAAQTPPALTPPVLQEFVEAPFPESEVGVSEGASVHLQLAINAEGVVVAAAVLVSAGEAFDRAAVEAARQFRFTPAMRNGTPIPVRIEYVYEFLYREEEVAVTVAALGGRVIDRATAEGIEGITVSIDGTLTTTTDADGHFQFEELEPGTRTVTVTGERVATVATTEDLVAGERREVAYRVTREEESEEGEEEDEADFEFVVTAPRIRREVVATEVSATEGRRVPGTSGDVLRVVENLPGVGRAAAGSGTLVVWGAAPQDTRTYVAGIRIPRLYHDGGFRSVIHPDMVRSVELVPGGYAPQFGRGIGGIVNVRLRPLDEEGFHGSAALDVIDAAVGARAQIVPGLHTAATFRRSHLDSVTSLVTQEDVGSIIPIPRYYDGQFRLAYDLGANETLELGAFFSTDRIDRTVVSSDPTLTARDSRSSDFYRVYLRYDRQETAGNTAALLYYGQDFSSLLNRFGGVSTSVGSASHVAGARASWRGNLIPELSLEVGLDAEVVASSLTRTGAIGAPPREGDARVFGQPPSSGVGADVWDVLTANAGVYAMLGLDLFDHHLQINPGVRLEPYLLRPSRATPRVGNTPNVGAQRMDLEVEPRLSATLQLIPQLSIRASVGLFHQAPQAEDLSSVFGTPTLGPMRSFHYVLGSALHVDQLEIEASAFYTESNDLVWRNVAPQPFLAQALSQVGRGRSYGGQLLVRLSQIGPFFGWASYTLMRSERQDAPSLPWRLFDYDQTHVLTVLGSVSLGEGFELGVRARYATGMPRTPVLGAYYDGTADRYVPVFGARNTMRLPDFFSVDVRLTYTFQVETVHGEVFLEVINVTNNANAEEVVYDPTYTQRGYISGFPVLPVLGARATW
jgi:TonB family protein